MMKISVILLLVALVGVFAQPVTPFDASDALGQLKSWAGDTSASPLLWAPPTDGNPCSAYAVSNYNYTTFTFTPTSSGVRQIGVMAANAFRPNFLGFLYTSFNPTDPCTGLVRRLSNGNEASNTGALLINDPYNFLAGTTYTFVVSSSSLTYRGGAFVLSVFASTAVGTTATGPLWTPSYANGASCLSRTDLGTQNVATYTWTQANTQSVDILVFFENINYTPSQITARRTPFSIYAGAVTAQTLSANNCPGGSNSLLLNAYEGDLMTGALRFGLTANTQYTIAVSSNTAGNFGVQVTPTRTYANAYPLSFAQPNRSPISPCSASANTAAGFVAPPAVVAAYDTHFVDLYAPPSYASILAFPSTAFVYSGAVTTSANIPACPTSNTLLAVQDIGCATTCASTSGPLYASTTVGSTYTFIISTQNGTNFPTAPSSSQQWGAQVFVLAGNNLNPSAPTSSSTSTTGSISTTTTTTTGSSTNATTSTSSTSTSGSTTGSATSSTSTTSGAVSVSVSAFLFVAAFLALLF